MSKLSTVIHSFQASFPEDPAVLYFAPTRFWDLETEFS